MSKEEIPEKVAIVTGAAQGMGRGITEKLAGAGLNVVVCDLDGDKAKSVAKNIGGLGLKADVTNEEEVESMVQDVLEHFGTIDVLVNNAGILRPTKIEGISKKEWDLVLDVNLNGTFLCSKAVLETMKEKGFGRIISMSSSAGRSVSTLGGAHYTAAKAAVLVCQGQ